MLKPDRATDDPHTFGMPISQRGRLIEAVMLPTTPSGPDRQDFIPGPSGLRKAAWRGHPGGGGAAEHLPGLPA